MPNSEYAHTVDTIIQHLGNQKNKVIPILQAIQDKYNYLPKEALEYVCEKTEITPAQITGVSTFYSQFRHKPVGEHIVKVCVGTACHVKGATLVHDALKRDLKIAANDDTDAKGEFTIEKVACLGCCTLAPVVQIDDTTYGHIIPEKVGEMINDFREQLKNGKATENQHNDAFVKKQLGEIRIGLGSCCVASGSAEVKAALETSIADSKMNVKVKQVGCVGVCNQVPLLEIHTPNSEPVFYSKVSATDVKRIVQQHFAPTNWIDRAKNTLNRLFENMLDDNQAHEILSYKAGHRDSPITAFLDKQINIATEYHGVINPIDIDEYRLNGGFIGLKRCITELSRETVIHDISLSGLRGRGGAGFPSGTKWKLVYEAPSEKKYIICNGDEGDPGAFMDRMILESYPFRVIEGMSIAAYAIGATEGFFYIRAEYPLAVKRVKQAIEICQQHGLLGNNILGTHFSLTLSVVEGAGAFVCGEETALIASIEGKRGMPQIRPPYPAERGLWNLPTLINNTETFSLVPFIMRRGALVFNKIGTEKSKGTKVFALAGKITRGGLIEVQMGITIRKIVEEIGGGIANGKRFKAVQIGGPSGGCIPAELADTPVDFESLTQVGAMMGSGGLVVLDEDDCMVDIAKYFLTFTQEQSCGKCTFCRIGTKRMLDILEKLSEGKAKPEDLELLEQLAHSTKAGSLCGLGKTAPNPVLSTLKYFRHEYEAHINGFCPSKKCTALITYSITNECIGCTKCAQRCPVNAIEMKPYEIHSIDTQLCIHCDICRQVCPNGSVIIETGKKQSAK